MFGTLPVRRSLKISVPITMRNLILLKNWYAIMMENKLRGNKHFRKKEYEKAITAYPVLTELAIVSARYPLAM